jgi:RNA polymerase sigma-70 factor, ECF subfamily
MPRQRTEVAVTPDRMTVGAERANRAADDGAEVFAGLRRRLFGIAYRVLGSWDGAEDVVQDVWVRWERYDRRTVKDPTAFLVTATIRLTLTATQTARARRETSLGDWTPQCSGSGADPASDVVQAEELEHAIQLLLERLTPTERAAFILREAFDYPYAKIACLLEMTEVNARQVVCRAGKSLSKGRHRMVVVAERRQLTSAFVAAAARGDLVKLEAFVISRPADCRSSSRGDVNQASEDA